MPTYEYRCPDGHTFERFVKMSEAASELECPTCGKIATRQLSGGAGIVFKGSGFYLTDYGKNAHRKGAPEGTSSASKDGDSASGDSKGGAKGADAKSSDSKPAESKTTEAKSDSKSSESKGGDKPSSSSSASSTSASKKPDA